MGFLNLKKKFNKISEAIIDSKEKCRDYIKKGSNGVIDRIKEMAFNKSKNNAMKSFWYYNVTGEDTEVIDNLYRKKNIEKIILEEFDNIKEDETNIIGICIILNQVDKIKYLLNDEQKAKYDRLKARYEYLKKLQEDKIQKRDEILSSRPKMFHLINEDDIKKNNENNLKPDINNYANLDRFNISEKKNETLTFGKAISIIRDQNIHSQDEWEMAMSKLAHTFGKNKKSKSNVTAKLNDFNKTEKLMAEYGRKINSGNYSGEDKLIYNALLYHLAKCDVLDNFSFDTLEDDINDYIADEALRYANDLNGSQKVLKK